MEISRKKVEICLQSVKDFSNPKVELEQYMTRPDVASYWIDLVQKDITQKIVLDLCSGTGMLTIASLMYNCAHCFSVEIDYDALQLQKDNISEILDKRLYLTRLSLIQNNALDLSFKHQIDTVIVNPPFGTKWTANIDTKILKKAFELATVVYSIHKTSTSEFIKKFATMNNMKVKAIADVEFDLPNTLRFHQKKAVTIKTRIFKFWR